MAVCVKNYQVTSVYSPKHLINQIPHYSIYGLAKSKRNIHEWLELLMWNHVWPHKCHKGGELAPRGLTLAHSLFIQERAPSYTSGEWFPSEGSPFFSPWPSRCVLGYVVPVLSVCIVSGTYGVWYSLLIFLTVLIVFLCIQLFPY